MPLIVDGQMHTCEGCVFFSPNRKPGETNGQCRRFPPSIERTDHGVKSLWPLVEVFGWCGEHMIKDAGGRA